MCACVLTVPPPFLPFAPTPQVSFLMIHQSKGTPVWADQGAYNDLTFWEQIDGGRPWTPARKVFLIVPILL